jgi:hypothetical protein
MKKNKEALLDAGSQIRVGINDRLHQWKLTPR